MLEIPFETSLTYQGKTLKRLSDDEYSTVEEDVKFTREQAAHALTHRIVVINQSIPGDGVVTFDIELLLDAENLLETDPERLRLAEKYTT